MIKITINDEPAIKHISKQLKQRMTDYMTRGNDVNDPDIIEESPFRRIYTLPPNRDTPEVEKALQGAQKIRNTVKSRGSIGNDSAVEEACPWTNTAMERDWVYYRIAGPLASTATDIRWNTAYRLTDDAPKPNSEAWKQAASKLEIPETNEHAPGLVSGFYSYLYDKQEKDNRPCHPEELIGEANLLAPDHIYDRAFQYLDELPFVESPQTDAPAWVKIEDDATEESATGETYA